MFKNEEYATAFKTKGPQDSGDWLFMVLILQQQKMISKLIEKNTEQSKEEKVKVSLT